jgi:hypothetical protein
VKVFSSKRRWTAAAILLLLLFLFRPGVSPLKSRIILSISSGVGRPVDIGSVRIRLLPRPGFELDNLVVYDDAAFGSEPMLRSSEVTATVRLLSLLRGRMEIGSLELTEPSLNLVRGNDGRWNLETLLERTAHIPLAPTAKAKSEPRPGFPYIEGSSGRINFMAGREKKSFSLTNADFALWQDSENAWGMRLKAQPVRTDMNSNDTGILRIDGTWQRAETLRDTPLQFTLAWEHPQLGQLTKLFTGNDQGWRGGVQWEATVSGTPAKLRISSDAAIQDFRRYDITSGDPLQLAVHCDTQYSAMDRAFHEVLCGAPVGGGLLTLKGMAGLPRSHLYSLALSAEDVPASAVMALVRRAKKNLPDDLTAAGTLRGSVSFDGDGASDLRAEGRGEITGFRLASTTDKGEIGPMRVPIVVSMAANDRNVPKRAGGLIPEGMNVEFGPVPGVIGHTVARGWFNRAGYRVSLAGEAEIAKTLSVARMAGIPAVQAPVEGMAQMEIEIAGHWAGWNSPTQQRFSGPMVTGSARLRNVRVTPRGTGGPIEIATADLRLAPDQAQVQKLSARTANTTWSGSMEMPRGCGTPSACVVHFNLKANQIALGAWSEWASPQPKARPWYRVLESVGQPQPSFFANVRAVGHITADRLLIHNLSASHVAANVALDSGKLTISEITADLLGGKYLGEWKTDFRGNPAASVSEGNLIGVSLAGLQQTTPGITGTVSGSYQVTATGRSAAELWQSVEGALHFDVRQGVLARISLEDDGPLKIQHLSGRARVHAGKLEFSDATLDSSEGKFQVAGTASWKRELEVKLTRASGSNRGYAITGTLAAPRVEALPGAEQARLKR